MPVVVPTGAHGSDTAENCGGAADAALFAVVDVTRLVMLVAMYLALFSFPWFAGP